MRSDAAALEPLLQPLLVLRDFLPRLSPRKRPDDQPEQAVSLQVELDRDARAAFARRLDGHDPDRPHGPVRAAERGAAGRVVLGDLVRDALLAARDLAQVGGAAADTRRGRGVAGDADDRGLPLAVTLELVDVGEDVLGTAGDLNAFDDLGHGRS